MMCPQLAAMLNTPDTLIFVVVWGSVPWSNPYLYILFYQNRSSFPILCKNITLHPFLNPWNEVNEQCYVRTSITGLCQESRWQISLPFHLPRLVKSPPFCIPEAWKRYPFRAELRRIAITGISPLPLPGACRPSGDGDDMDTQVSF